SRLPPAIGRRGRAGHHRRTLDEIGDLGRHQASVLIAALVWLALNVQYNPARLRIAIARAVPLYRAWVGLKGRSILRHTGDPANGQNKEAHGQVQDAKRAVHGGPRKIDLTSASGSSRFIVPLGPHPDNSILKKTHLRGCCARAQKTGQGYGPWPVDSLEAAQ